MGDLTALYLTDNSVEPKLDKRIKELLLEATGDISLVSVSQKPIDLGKNICVGEIGSCAVSMFKQMVTGLKVIDTPLVAIAEHDCIYSKEHFAFRPPDDRYFWYNTNVWLVQYHNPKFPEYDGMFSFWNGRRVQSQLICNTSLLLEATEKRLEIASADEWPKDWTTSRIGEPGTAYISKSMKIIKGRGAWNLRHKLSEYIINYNAKDFTTKTPSIDIRHGGNLTGQRRGKKRRFELEPWGTLKDILE